MSSTAPLARDYTAAPQTATPADLAIEPRDLRFLRDSATSRWWIKDDPVGSAWFVALSATFPRGEGMFIEAVKAHRDGTPPQLEAAIRAFVKQEINHTREHLVFNKAAADAGFDLARIDARLEQVMGMIRERPQIVNLAATIALEHYTAMMAHEFLANPQHFRNADPVVAAMWRWHAIEEIEHKGVAFDTWLHATRSWSRWKRWRLKSTMMLVITVNFLRNRWVDTLDLLAQGGHRGWRTKARLAWYLFGTPGVLRKIAPAWVAYFLPGFHPWQHDDRGLIAGAQRDLAAAGF